MAALGGRLWTLPWLPALMEDLPLRLEGRPPAALPQVSHSALDGALRRPQPLGKRCALSTAPTASATTIGYSHIGGKEEPDSVRCPLNADTTSNQTRTQLRSLKCPRSSESVSTIVGLRKL